MKKYTKLVIATMAIYISALVVLICASVNTTAAPSYTGSGTESNPYVVSTGAELIEVLNLYNQEGVYIELDNDITLGTSFEPVNFYANLDGNFHKITSKTFFSGANYGFIKNLYYICTEEVRNQGIGDGFCTNNAGILPQ